MLPKPVGQLRVVLAQEHLVFEKIEELVCLLIEEQIEKTDFEVLEYLLELAMIAVVKTAARNQSGQLKLLIDRVKQQLTEHEIVVGEFGFKGHDDRPFAGRLFTERLVPSDPPLSSCAVMVL